MNDASRSWSVVLVVCRCTVGVGNPDASTSFFACFGSYGVHLTLGLNHAPSSFGSGVQLGGTRPPKTTLTSASRSIASSNACRSIELDASGVPTLTYGFVGP